MVYNQIVKIPGLSYEMIDEVVKVDDEEDQSALLLAATGAMEDDNQGSLQTKSYGIRGMRSE